MSGNLMLTRNSTARRVLLIVAYPGDETLWAGGYILTKPDWQWNVISLFNSDVAGRSESFSAALTRLAANGEILHLPDTTGDTSASKSEIHTAILRAMESYSPNLLITHNPMGECAWHYGRGALGGIVTKMWGKGQVAVPRIGIFAYKDDRGRRLPWADDRADWYTCLPSKIWAQKRDILLSAYGFASDSFVARSCPREEAFYWFNNPADLRKWSQRRTRDPETPNRKQKTRS